MFRKFMFFLSVLCIAVICSCTQPEGNDPVKLTSIEVTKPTKLTYTEGEKFDPTDMVVTAVFSDGTKKNVDDYIYTPDGELTLFDTTITVSYTFAEVTKRTSFKITVIQKPELESIYVATAPDKINYLDGENFDKTGMVVKARFQQEEVEIFDYTVTPEKLSYENTFVEISYIFNGKTKTAKQDVSVKPIVKSIEITTNPKQLSYIEEEKFNPEGMVVLATYSDNKQVNVSGYEWSPKRKLTTNDTEITISYTEDNITVTATIEIEVSEKPAAIEIDYESIKANYGNFEISGGLYDETTEGVIILTPKLEKTEYKISGYYNGQIVNTVKNTIITLNGAYLENSSGEPAILSSKKLEISMKKDSVNYIISTGTSAEKNAAIVCYDSVAASSKNLELGGSGTGYIVGNICHGIKADEVKAKGTGVYYISGTANGSGINCNTFLIEAEKSISLYLLNSKNGIKADKNISISSGSLYFSDIGTCLKTDTSKDDGSSEHSITLENCSIFTRNVSSDGLYKTEAGNFISGETVVIDEF